MPAFVRGYVGAWDTRSDQPYWRQTERPVHWFEHLGALCWSGADDIDRSLYGLPVTHWHPEIEPPPFTDGGGGRDSERTPGANSSSAGVALPEPPEPRT